MTRLRRGDDDLHYADGSHRGTPATTPATTDGAALEVYERRIRAHLEDHRREEENRLTDHDRSVMAAKVVGQVAEWDFTARQRTGIQAAIGSDELIALNRVAARAIGCDGRDLRAVERDAIRGLVLDLVGGRVTA